MKLIDKDNQEYQEAKKRVEEEKKFYQHLGVYIVMSIFFVVLNLATSPDHLWFYWPILGWGLGVALQAARVFTNFGFSKEWEDKRIERYMDKNKRDRH